MKKQAGLFLILPVILLNLSLHIYLASHTRFISDDYCSAAIAERLGILRAAWYWYLNWSGRYSASVLDSIFGLLGPWATGIAIPVILFIWLIVLMMAIHQFINHLQGGSWNSLLFGANILFLTFLLAPNIRQSVYWGQGMRSVLPPMILFTLYVGWFRWRLSREQNKKEHIPWILAGFLFAFGIGGFNETFAVLQIILLSMLLLFALAFVNHFDLKTSESQVLIFALAGALVSFIVIFIAPGNANRQAELPPSPGVMETLVIASRSFLIFLRGLIDSVPKIFGLLGGVGIGILVGYQSDSRLYSKRMWFLLTLSTFVVVYASFLPAAYGLSDSPPGRTLIIPVYVISIAIVALGFFVGNYLQQHFTGIRLGQGLTIVTIILYFTSSSLVNLDLIQSRKIFIDFANKWDRMHMQILADKAANQKQSVVPTMDNVNWAGATTFHDGPKFWLNRCVSQYYGIETIAVDNAVLPDNESQ